MSYRVATVDELQDIPYREDTHMRPVRHHLGITAFGTNAWTATKEATGSCPSTRRTRASRSCTSSCAAARDSRSTATRSTRPTGALVFVGRKRTGQPSRTSRTTVLAVGSRVGKPYEAGGWEVWAEFHPAYEAGRLRGRDRAGRARHSRRRLRHAALQPRLLRGADRPHRGRDRSSSRGDRAAAEPARAREGGHRLRPAPGRAGVPRARSGEPTAPRTG